MDDSLVKDYMKEVESIPNGEIRDFTLKMVSVAPKAFWEKKASRRHHPKDECLPKGNLIHSTRVTKITGLMIQLCEIKDPQGSMLISGASLHDLCRNGIDGSSPFTVEEHPYLVRKLALAHGITCFHADAIFYIIEKHLAQWGKPPYRVRLKMEDILCLADYISAKAHEVWDL